jgi:hypothetical protein
MSTTDKDDELTRRQLLQLAGRSAAGPKPIRGNPRGYWLPDQGSNLLCGLGCQPPPVQIVLVPCVYLVATSFYRGLHRMLKAGVIELPGPLPGPPSIRADVKSGHHILHTRKALGQTPVTNAPLLGIRPPLGSPGSSAGALTSIVPMHPSSFIAKHRHPSRRSLLEPSRRRA